MLKSYEELESLFPPKPEEPLKADCCGTGCSPCVFDIYRAQLSEWEIACHKVVENGGRTTSEELPDYTPILSQLQYSPFQLTCIRPLTADTNIYRFQAIRLGEDGPVKIMRRVEFKIGQHLILRNSPGGEHENVVTRAYTPISGSIIDAPGCFDVLMKLYSDGKMSGYIKNLKEDDIVHWRGPYGNFSYASNKYKYLFMFCAGTGVAPMYPIAKAIVEDETDETMVRLLFSCKKRSDILLRDEICELAGFWNFTARTFLSQDVAEGGRYMETLVTGRITSSVVCNELEGMPMHNVLVLICGTKSFNKDMLNYVQQAGVPSVNVHMF